MSHAGLDAPLPTPPDRPAPVASALLGRWAEVAPIGIFLLDAAGRARFVNPRMTAITGRDASWLRDEAWPLLAHPDDRPSLRLALARLVEGELPRLCHAFRVLLPDGGERRVAMDVSRVPAEGHTDAEGVDGFAGVLEDVTERHALEGRAREAQKMEAVGRLASGIAHDFNNLLTVIRSYTDFLAADLPEGDPRRADAHQIVAATERAAALTRQLLAFGRRPPSTARRLDLRRALRDLRPTLARAVGPEVRLELSASADVVEARLDPGQLEQLLLALVANAREAMPDGGALAITASATTLAAEELVRHVMETQGPAGTELPGEYVVLAVRDDGHGMDPETRSRMFEPLFTTKAPDAGTGLGLATVWGIVTQAGGHLRVRSAPGAGTTVEVWLPGAPLQTPPRAMSAVPGPASAAHDQTILLVEDEPAVRTSVRRILERAGYRVLEARNGVDGRLAWEAHRDDVALVLSDVMMPEADGVELASALRAQAPDVRFVFMSGYSGEETNAAQRLGADALMIEKPFEARILLERVRQALER